MTIPLPQPTLVRWTAPCPTCHTPCTWESRQGGTTTVDCPCWTKEKP